MSQASEKLEQLLNLRQLKRYRKVLLFSASRLTGVLGHSAALRISEFSQFDAVYGSQIGSVFAAMHSMKLSYKNILYYAFNDLRQSDIFDLRISDFLIKTLTLNPLDLDGVCHGRELEKVLKRLFSRSHHKPRDLYIFAEYFNRHALRRFKVPEDIELIKAIRAAVAMAAVYSPVEHQGETYIDSGIFGGLPLQEVYQHQASISKRPLLIVAFQEAFTSKYPKLTLLERMVYSFYEKVRYHSALIELEEVKNLPVIPVVISFHSGSMRDKNLFSMSQAEKWQLYNTLGNEIHEQLDFYLKQLSMGIKKCETYSFTR